MYMCAGPLAEKYDRFLRCSWAPMLPKRIRTLQRMKVGGGYFAPIPPRPEPALVPGKSQPHCVVNLHIFADPAHRFQGKMASMNDEHPMAAFAEVMRLTQVPELRLRLRKGDRPVVLPDASVREGLPKSELMSLAESGLLDGRDMAAAAVGAGSWLSLSGGTAQTSDAEDHGNDRRRAFLGRVGACALGSVALSQIAFGVERPINCADIIIDPRTPPAPPRPHPPRKQP